MNVVIRAENLTKVYKTTEMLKVKKQVVFENLNLEIFEGEVFGLLGLNGSGKTTLMKILLGLIFPTKGTAWVLGKKIGNKEVKRKIGFLPEIPYFSRYSTPDDILSYYAKLYGFDFSLSKKKIDEALEIVGLTKKRKTQLKEFSKGMLQRVAMAQLLINEPKLVFLDEPTFGLDPLIAREMRNLIILMKKQKRTVFLSSHQISEIEKVCDRIGILHNGKIVKTSEVVFPLSQRDNSDSRSSLEEFFIKTVS